MYSPILILSLFVCAFGRKIVSRGIKIYDGRTQYIDAVDIIQQQNVWNCLLKCQGNVRCLTFFHNKDTSTCILHSKTFEYVLPNIVENGWKMYVFEDVLSRCHYTPNKFLYYRHLGLCYNINPPVMVDYTNYMKPTCATYGGSLIKINSLDKQDYISYVLAGRVHDRVAIQGDSFNPGDAWLYDDGTPLVYSNFRFDEPSPGSWYLQIFQGDLWTDQNDYRSDLVRSLVVGRNSIKGKKTPTTDTLVYISIGERKTIDEPIEKLPFVNT